jgi:hypothetical protein
MLHLRWKAGGNRVKKCPASFVPPPYRFICFSIMAQRAEMYWCAMSAVFYERLRRGGWVFVEAEAVFGGGVCRRATDVDKIVIAMHAEEGAFTAFYRPRGNVMSRLAPNIIQDGLTVY